MPKKTLKKIFNQDGLISVKNFLNKNQLKEIEFILLKNLYPSVDRKEVLKKKFDFEVHKKLINMRANNPKKFGEMYDRINLSSSLRSIFYSQKFLDKFTEILGIKKEDLFINGFMLRLDVPFDTRNTLDWHQDSTYYEMTYPKYNAGVCWVAFTNNSNANGSLQYINKSHKKLIQKFKVLKNENMSEQRKITIDEQNKKNISTLNAKRGDANFFHMNMIHRSGINSSNKVRISLACRFHSMQKFNLGKEIFFYNKTENYKLKL